MNSCLAHTKTGLAICANSARMDLGFARSLAERRSLLGPLTNVVVERTERNMLKKYAIEYALVDANGVNKHVRFEQSGKEIIE